MGILEQIERDLKTALLAGDKRIVETLKGLKNAIQYEAVSLKVHTSELEEEQLLRILSREAKKRQEAADMYASVSEQSRSAAELAEKEIIERYLPERLAEADIDLVVIEEVNKISSPTTKDIGAIIAAVRQRLGAQAEGAIIARLVKTALENK